jgi:LmbE family N-acetylglucosaminyl deacetylase
MRFRATDDCATASEVDGREVAPHNDLERLKNQESSSRGFEHRTAFVGMPFASRIVMSEPPKSTLSECWLPAFDMLLETVRDCGPHGQLVDVRESLRTALGPDRPLVILCPHADDGAITAACLLHEYAVRRGLPVIEVLVFAGERNVAAPWLNNQTKATVREAEFRLECNILGAEGVFWDLDAYRMPGYLPTASDVGKVVAWFKTRRPGAVILPPPNDAHVAHRVTRALAAIGLVGASLADCLVLSGWTPWGPLARPNAYLTYDGEAERTKEWAIHCHASQVFLTDYTQYCSHLGRAYAALTREWAEGHSLSGRAHRTDERFVGVELFQIEAYDPRTAKTCPADPVQIALGILSGQIEPDSPRARNPDSKINPGAPEPTPAVAQL